MARKQLTHIAYEAPIFPGRNKLSICGYSVQIDAPCYRRSIPVIRVNINVLKKFVGVKGAEEPIDAACVRGLSVINDHEADAVWLCIYVAEGSPAAKTIA